MLSRHRQGGDEHGDAAKHENRPHQAAQAPQKNGPAWWKKQLIGFNRVGQYPQIVFILIKPTVINMTFNRCQTIDASKI